MASHDSEARRISDVDRDSKSLRDAVKRTFDEAKLDRRRLERDFPRTLLGEVSKVCYTQHHSRTEFGMSNEYPQNHTGSKFAEFSSIITEEKLPTFDGSSLKLDFLDWIDTFEDYFDSVNLPETVKCKLVASKLKGEARLWWKELQNHRFSEGKNLITTWPRMSKLLIKKFLHTSCLTYFHNQLNKQANEGNQKHVNCSMKFPNQCSKQENEEVVKHTNAADGLSHADCSIEVPLESYINKHDGEKDQRPLMVAGLISEDNGIETSKKSTPYTSRMEESQLEYSPSTRKHCVKAVTLTCPNSENSKVEEKSIGNLIETELIELEIQTDVMLGVFEDHKVGVEHEATNITEDSNVGSPIVNVSTVIKVVSDDFQGSNVFSAFEEVLKMGPYDVDFLVNDTIMHNFDPGGTGKWNRDDGQRHLKFLVCLVLNLWLVENVYPHQCYIFGKYFWPSWSMAIEEQQELKVGKSRQLEKSSHVDMVKLFNAGSDLLYVGSWHHCLQRVLQRLTLSPSFTCLVPDFMSNFPPAYMKPWKNILDNLQQRNIKIGMLSMFMANEMSSTLEPSHSPLLQWNVCVNYQYHKSPHIDLEVIMQLFSKGIETLASIRKLVDLTGCCRIGFIWKAGTLSGCTNAIWHSTRIKKIRVVLHSFYLKGSTCSSKTWKSMNRIPPSSNRLLTCGEIDLSGIVEASSYVVIKEIVLLVFDPGGCPNYPRYGEATSLVTGNISSLCLYSEIGTLAKEREELLVKNASNSRRLGYHEFLSTTSNFKDSISGAIIDTSNGVTGILTIYETSKCGDRLKLGARSVKEAACWVCSSKDTTLKGDQNQVVANYSLFEAQPLRSHYSSNLQLLSYFDSTIGSFKARDAKACDILTLFIWMIFGYQEGPMLHQEVNDTGFNGKWSKHFSIMVIGVVDASSEIIFQTSMRPEELLLQQYKGREHDDAHIFLTNALCIIDKHDEVIEEYRQCSLQTDINLNLTRGRVIPWEGWNDDNNTNMEMKLIMVEISAVIIGSCVNTLCKNGQSRGSLRLFHKVVNGLDPPMDLDGICEASVWIYTSSLVDELLRRRDGLM